jgi:hypothetical protein
MGIGAQRLGRADRQAPAAGAGMSGTLAARAVRLPLRAAAGEGRDRERGADRGDQPVNFGPLLLVLRMTKCVCATMRVAVAPETGSSNGPATGGLCGQPPDPGGVARLDRVDGQRRGEVGARADVGCLALVSGDGEVLEGHRGAPERVGALGRPAEVEMRPLDRLGAQHVTEGAHVGALVRADGVGLALELAWRTLLRSTSV